MKILFISSNLIGDSILSTGILSKIIESSKNSKITLITGPTAYQLFENFPNIENIIIVKKMRFNLHWFKLWGKLIINKWDVIVDLRSSFLSYFLISNNRKIFRKNTESIPQVEKLSYFFNEKDILLPKIWIKKNDQELAKSIIGNRIVIGIAPGGNWIPKIWPIENYNKLINELDKKFKEKKLFFLIVGSKKEEKDYYNKLTTNISKERLINIMGKSLTLTYACFSLCKFFIGNDSGLMHLSAASSIPTIGLFGPTRDDWYRPYGRNCYVLRTKESYDMLRKNLHNTNLSLMHSIKVNDVIKFIENKNLIY